MTGQPHSELFAEVRDFIDSYAIGTNQQKAASVAFDGLEEQFEALREAAELRRNVLIWPKRDISFEDEWVAVPREDFDALRALSNPASGPKEDA